MDTRILKTLLVSRMAQRKLRSMTLSKTIHQWLITQIIRTNSCGAFFKFLFVIVITIIFVELLPV